MSNRPSQRRELNLRSYFFVFTPYIVSRMETSSEGKKRFIEVL